MTDNQRTKQTLYETIAQTGRVRGPILRVPNRNSIKETFALLSKEEACCDSATD
jgi:hypothetical protein